MNNPRSSFPVWKRIADIVLSSAALIVLSPLLLLIAAVIKTVSSGRRFCGRSELDVTVKLSVFGSFARCMSALMRRLIAITWKF